MDGTIAELNHTQIASVMGRFFCLIPIQKNADMFKVIKGLEFYVREVFPGDHLDGRYHLRGAKVRYLVNLQTFRPKDAIASPLAFATLTDAEMSLINSSVIWVLGTGARGIRTSAYVD